MKIMKMRLTAALFIFTIVFAGGCVRSDELHQISDVGHSYPPKNVIIFIADGAGFNHFGAADYYQCNKVPCQPYESFSVCLAMSTYPVGGSYDANAVWHSFDYVKHNPTDSAAAATAMATGVKSYNAAIGVDIRHKPVMNLLERAEQMGKSTGVVTSVPFSHATPAGFAVHNGSRNNYTQIADDMLNKSAAEVVMGCGSPLYNEDGKPKFMPDYKYISSKDWSALSAGLSGGDADGDNLPDHWTLVQTRAQFQALASGPTPKRVCGIPQVFDTLQQKRSGNTKSLPYEVALTQTVPTLGEMTLAALNVLDNNPNGLFVMIEGGAVDWAAHDNHSGRLVEEMNDFNLAVKAAIQWINNCSNWNDTLVIITADHETGYITGPGSGQPLLSNKPVWNDLVGKGIGMLPAMEWHSGSHTNSLVPFFAKGRGAEQFIKAVEGFDPVRGPYIDNTDIAGVILTMWSGAVLN
jgi:alkaline phosphatase